MGAVCFPGRRTRVLPRDRRWRFVARLLASTLVVLVALGLALHLVQSAALRRILVRDGLERHRADARLIDRTFRSAGGQEARREVSKILAHIQNRPGVRGAYVIDSEGSVLVAGDTEEEGKHAFAPALEAVFQDGRPRFEAVQEDGVRLFGYLTPVELPTGRVVLEVEETAVLLEEQLAVLRRSSLQAVGLSLMIALPLLWLVGGRSLADRYRSAEERSLRDSLTNLANHRSFQEELHVEVARSVRHGMPLSVAMIDVDDFKVINDQRGHRHGDEILVALAAVLEAGRVSDRAFRVGGDEFALVLPHTDKEGAYVAAEAFRRAAAERLSGPTISVGLATLGSHGDANVLRDQADAALYEAKRMGRNRVVCFDESTQALVLPAEKVQALLRLLEEGRISAVFQPIWRMPEGRVMAFEGLARPAEDYGFTGPLEAFLVAERVGRVDELDALCRRAVLEGARGLPPDVLLFVNVSPQVLDHESLAGHGLVEEVEAVGLVPERVVIEVTERSTERLSVVVQEATRLRRRGFGLALDDVGSGNAGLEMLLQVPFDFVKVDREVVVSARHEGPGGAVLAAVCAFASETGAFVIAEGVEDRATLEVLQQLVIRHRLSAYGAQGYLLGRPGSGFDVFEASLSVASPGGG
ncbi:MAG: EAL domain-containing protein [Actinomycetota bacterium]|nr:EAL domain-containing protein [Actinomycetota bacterium]